MGVVELFHSERRTDRQTDMVNPLNVELNPVRHLLALVGAHQFVHVIRVRVKLNSLFRNYANRWIEIRSAFYLSDSHINIVTCRHTFPRHLHGDAKTQTASIFTVSYVCTNFLATMQTASPIFASVLATCLCNRFPHHSLLVDSCYCTWKCMGQSYGLTYYSLH